MYIIPNCHIKTIYIYLINILDIIMYQRLHKIRSDKGLSQTELANLSGIGQSVISKIERGALTSPSSDTLTKLASTLECSVIDFIDFNNSSRNLRRCSIK